MRVSFSIFIILCLFWARTSIAGPAVPKMDQDDTGTKGLNISVESPLWEKRGAIFGYTVFIFFIFYGIIRYRTQDLRIRNLSTEDSDIFY